MKTTIFLLFLSLSYIINAQEQERDVMKIIQKNQCATCHGINGIPQSSRRPILAGQKKDYIIRRLEFFRDGVLDKTNIMNLQAKTLTDLEIRLLAEYFENQGFKQ